MAISVFDSGVVWVTDTHTEASPPRSPPHKVDTEALEELLKGTRLTRKVDPSSNPSANPSRCIKKGKCSLRGTHCKGNLVPSRSKLHIRYLEPRRSFGPKGVPTPLLEPYCYHNYGQHHGSCLFKGGGG